MTFRNTRIHTLFYGDRAPKALAFCVVFCRSLYCRLRGTASDYPIDILKHFINSPMGPEVIGCLVFAGNAMLLRLMASDYPFDIVKLFIYKSLVGLVVIEYFMSKEKVITEREG